MVSKTYHAILDGFNRLIKDTDFNKISVDMIMKKAGVSRSTFYRYFKDKYEVMNANFKNLLDYYATPERSCNYRELCFHLFQFAQNNPKLMKKAMASTGYNSLQNYIYESSYQTALEITKANRNGKGFTPVEELQVDIFCNGICAVYKKLLDDKYNIDAGDAADALYEMMPESLKHYWWK
jgi:AcrR family transcriptional regulator